MRCTVDYQTSPFWRSPKVHVDCPHECPVASVGERGDHQSAAVAEVLVAILQIAAHHAHADRVVTGRLTTYRLALQVEAKVLRFASVI